MVRPFKKDLNFLGKRKIFFAVSVLLMLVSVGALAVRGLTFSVEFVGGTNISFIDTGEITIDEMRTAFIDQGVEQPTVQTRSSGSETGIKVGTPETDATVASDLASRVAVSLGLSDSSYQVMTVGPQWGAEVASRSLIAFLVALAVIILYIAIRFEYKMGIVAVGTLIHDLIIVVGVYALFGREITPNVVAALLTIMGYSLYDTVVVFHRINDNVDSAKRHSFITVANHSVNQVLLRSINTTVTTMVPVLAMLFFGGDTLRDFAFAMSIGLVLGAYSSIALASPLYALWKQREPRFKLLYKKYGEGVDVFSASEDLAG